MTQYILSFGQNKCIFIVFWIRCGHIYTSYHNANSFFL